MTFDEIWVAMEQRKGGPIDRDVKLTPANFKKALKQAYEIGYKAGLNESPRRHEDDPVNRFLNMFGMK